MAATAKPGGMSQLLDELRHPDDDVITKSARCADPRSTYAELFFSEDPRDGARAKAICARCNVKTMCLSRAIERAEPYGVWGGEFVVDGKVVEARRTRGRPPRKAPAPLVVDEVTGVDVAIVA